MVSCSNDMCKRGRWFHYTCVNETDESIPEGDWWCSDECRKYSIFCLCKTNLPGVAMITCANQNCLIKKYHARCLGIPDEDIRSKN